MVVMYYLIIIFTWYKITKFTQDTTGKQINYGGHALVDTIII